ASLAVVEVHRVVAVRALVANDAGVRADHPAVVTAVADSAAEAAVSLADRHLLGVAEPHLQLLGPDPLLRLPLHVAGAGRVPEVAQVEAPEVVDDVGVLVRDVDRTLLQEQVDRVGDLAPGPDGLDHHAGAVHDVAGSEELGASHAAVLAVRLDQPVRGAVAGQDPQLAALP